MSRNRSRTVERRKQREQERRRQRQIAAAIGVAVIAVLALAAVVLANLPAEAPIPEGAVEQYSDLQRGTTEEGFPILGDPDAPVELVEYSNFSCPGCQVFYETVTPGLVERVAAGDISFTYVPLYFTEGDSTNSRGAARAAVCASEQDAFWPYHSALYTWANLYGNTAFAGNRLAAGIGGLGLDTGAWEACMSSDRPDDVLQAAITSANNVLGFAGTPTVTINGAIVQSNLDAINSAIDQALAAQAQPPAAEETSETSGDS